MEPEPGTPLAAPLATPPREAPPCTLVIVGATGDLTARKLVPALYSLARDGALPERTAVVGFARRPWSADDFRAAMRAGVDAHARRRPADAAAWETFAARLDFVPGEFDDADAYARLGERLATLERARGLGGDRLFYLAVPPDQAPVVVRHLKPAGLVHPPHRSPWARVIVEKPFGRDLASAVALNRLLAGLLGESQTFRIDHYLGKETVQNLLVLRFGNSIFEPVWNRNHIEHVEITMAESVGVERRGAFYERTGVLRDIVQNHLLEVLALVAMEPPTTGGADDVRSEKLKVLNALRDPWSDTIDRDVALGQYRGYRDEPGVAPDSVVPTFAALRVFVDNWRWQGVPFYLRTGKRLARRVTEVSLHLRPVPLSLFGRGDVCERIEPNVLTVRIQPDEGIELRFTSKIPGPELTVGTVKMDMSYVEAFGGESPDAYERLLLDAMRGDATLFSRRDAVEASWAWITPILEHLERPGAAPPMTYEPGSWGPPCADDLMRRDRRAWRAPGANG